MKLEDILDNIPTGSTGFQGLEIWILQLITLVVSTILIVVFSIVSYVVISKQTPEKKPGKFATFLIIYVSGFENLMDSITGGKLRPVYSYFFTIFNFILVNTLLSMFGFVPTPTALAFTFTLAFITFIGIYVVGIATNGIFHFIKHKYSNPIEIIGQISPLLSLTFRLFGATLATYIIGEIFVVILQSFEFSTLAMWYPLISVPWSWMWTLADAALGIIQAFVFAVLTALYWSIDHGPSWNREERRKHQIAEKELRKQQKLDSRKT